MEKNKALKEFTSCICNSICCYDYKDCPRKSWNTAMSSSRRIKLVNNRDECPLMQFEAEKGEWLENGLVRPPSIEAMWFMCEHCKHSDVHDGIVDIEPALEKICVDCPVFNLREIMIEVEGESSVS